MKNLPEALLGETEKPFDFKENANWRIFRILSEFIDGFEFLAPLKKEVTFFGSARLNSSNTHYQEARKLAHMLGKEGFTIITGGGPGIMEGANRGAFEAGAESVGINIRLPLEQRINPYVTRSEAFHYFFTRKVMLSASAQAYVFFPGGFGTLDEFFEIVTLIQTHKMEKIPVVLMGKDYLQPLLDWIDSLVYKKHKAIAEPDTKIYTLASSVKHAFEIVKKSKERKYF